MDPANRAKKACQRCRSLKARCPGPSSDTERCARCIKAGETTCVYEDHKRGRKVGTRLSDPTKALMRMKSALSVLQEAGELDGLEDIKKELLAKAGKVASSSKAKIPSGLAKSGNGKGKGKERSESVMSDEDDYGAYEEQGQTVNGFLNDDLYSHQPRQTTFHSGGGGPSTSSSGLPSILPPPHPTAQFPPYFPSSSTATPTIYSAPTPPVHLKYPHPSFSAPSHHPASSHSTSNQFDDLMPLKSSSKSLSTLFRPRSFPTPNEDVQLDQGRMDVVSQGLVGERHARELFAFFMSKVGRRIYLLDDQLHTHEYVRQTSSFLYATILSIALKYTNAPEAQFRRVLASARDGVLAVLAENVRSEGTVLALLLMTEFKGIDDEGTYVILGLAIRCAMDMDLSRPLPGLSERANRSRVRCWIALFNADRRFGGCGQVSKPEIMPEDSVIRASVTFHDHPLRTPGDARLISGTQVRRLISRYNDLIQTDGEAAQLNMREVYKGASGEIDGWADFWQGEITRMQGEDVDGIEVTRLHCKLMIAHHWIYRACRFPRSPWIHSPEDFETERRAALSVCLTLSVSILNQMVKMPPDAIRYSPDSNHLFYAYATFMLDKLFRARLLETHVLDPASQQAIFDLIRHAAERLESVTIFHDSATALHATLLRSLLLPGEYGPSSRSSSIVDEKPLVPLAGGGEGGTSVSPPLPTTLDSPHWPPATTTTLLARDQGPDPGLAVGLEAFSALDGEWEGLDQAALEALATLDPALGMFDWTELSYSPP